MEPKHSFTKYSLLLIPAGIAINFAFAQFALFFSIPLYLDSIGTILISIIGGYLPGIIVGFFSNTLNSLSDPITLYYGIISIIIASVASFLTSKGWFTKFSRVLAAAFIFAFIGGVLGSVLTWLLYGFGFGSGISAPFAVFLHEVSGFSKFYAQLTADFIIDVIDKLITVFLCFFAVKALPFSLMSKLPNGYLFDKSGSPADFQSKRLFFFRERSLRSKVVLLIALSAMVLGCLATTISYVLYKNIMTDHYINTATSVAEMELTVIDPDRINEYLSGGEKSEAYLAAEASLKTLRDNVPDIEYVYVYQIREDGCHVVFDVDTPDLPGEEAGTVVPIENAFLPYKEALLAGEEIPPIISNDSYGWLLTVYKPVIDSNGHCAAYAAADISMEDIRTDRAVFIIKMASLLFGVSIIIVLFALWFAERRLVDPINAIAMAADEFAYDSEDERLETTSRLQSLDIHTGDEIENLYNALKKTVTDVSEYIADSRHKANIISQMQDNIIISFADMVENRDLNTGQHIKHTAAYVQIIALALLQEGKYPDTINPDYINSIVRSAPLHDLGKIRISDIILNKPGRLTPEEFEQIKTHTTAGKEILEGIIRPISDTVYLSEAADMAAYHHERWDGSGYPKGLKGTEIPLSARIMAVADVYDALISKRSYKAPLSKDEAFDIICREAGTHFDPVVVDAFAKVKESIIAISK